MLANSDEYPILFTDNNYPQVHCANLDIEDFRVLDFNKNCISVICVNIRSCRKNFPKLQALLSLNEQNYFDFIILTETWMEENFDYCFNLPNFKKFSIYRNKHGGGLSIYVKDHFNATILTEFTFINNDLEILSLAINNLKFNFNISAIYRPPSSCINNFNDFLSDSFLPSVALSKTVVCGDFNIDLFNPHKSNPIYNFINTMAGFNYYPLINKPTRYSFNEDFITGTVIDHFWINFIPHDNIQSAVVESDVSDHRPILFHFSTAVEQNEQFFTYRNFKNELHRTNFINRTRQTNFLTDSNDPNFLAQDFCDKIYSNFNDSFPLKRSKKKNNFRNKDWITDDLKFLIKKKSQLAKLARVGLILKRSYIYFRNKLTNILRKCKNLFYQNQLLNSKGPKSTWNFINNILNRKSRQKDFKVKQSDRILTGSDLCNYFNDYFSSIALTLSDNIPVLTDSFNLPTPYILNEIQLSQITVAEVRDVILSFKRKNCHKNEIPYSILVDVLDFISVPLCNIFNSSILAGIYPSVFKIARVVPIFKSGSENDVNNFRPISTLPIFSKIFEKLLFNKLSNFIEDNEILNKSQYGFKKGVTTTHAILEFLHYVLRSFNQNSFCIALFLDLKKAFDTVDITILMKKLHHYGIRNNFNKLLGSYLSNRRQYVHINDFTSNFKTMNVGLYQGSTLSPILFNVYFNDVCNVASDNDFNCTLFADDAVFYCRDKCLDSLIFKLNNFIGKLSQWLDFNKLTPNISKTKIMIFNSHKQLVLPEIHFNNEILEHVHHFKYLGIFIDDKLTFKEHLSFLCIKLSQVKGILYAAAPYFNRKSLVLMYNSLAYSVFIQSIIVYGKSSNSLLQPLRTI